jgi:hypothetical protein
VNSYRYLGNFCCGKAQKYFMPYVICRAHEISNMIPRNVFLTELSKLRHGKPAYN